MLLGPIFSLELITGARRARYFWVRVAYALTLLFALWVTYESAVVRHNLLGIQGIANIARDFFFSFAMIQLVAVLVLTPAMVAGTIAQERERRTLEYLLTSQLSSGDIILGKLGARLLHVVFVLLAGIPVLATAMLLGGIPPLALLVTTATTLLTLVAVGALSIAVSVWRPQNARRHRQRLCAAVGRAHYSTSSGSSFHGASMHAPWQQIVDALAGACSVVADANPFLVVTASASSDFQRVLGGGWRQLLAIEASYVGFAVLCLLVAASNVRRAYSNDASRVARPRWWSSLYWRPAVGRYPMIWKELFAESAAGRLGWLGRTVLGLMVLAVVLPMLGNFYECWPNHGQQFIDMAVVMGDFVGCFGLLIVTARAATLVTSEKERDCWVSLLSTPLSAADIIRAKLLGNLYAARWIGLLLGMIWLLALLMDRHFLLIAVLLAATWLLLACYASCLGLTFSLLLRNSTRAMAAALATAIFFGGVYLMFALPILAIMAVAGRSDPWELMAICIPFLMSYPAMAWESRHSVNPSIMMHVAYVAGLAIYAAVSGALGLERRYVRSARRTHARAMTLVEPWSMGSRREPWEPMPDQNAPAIGRLRRSIGRRAARCRPRPGADSTCPSAAAFRRSGKGSLGVASRAASRSQP